MVTHVWVAEQAIEAIAPGPLRDIVADPALRAVIENGAIYPDSGYAVQHPYGEWAHWETWLEPYARWIAERYRGEGFRSPEARRHVAFLMGCAAHAMTDQSFDQYFVPRARQYDRSNADDLDMSSDVWLVVEHHVTSSADGQFWFDEMPSLHAATRGPAVTPMVLREAASRTASATRFLVRYGYTLYTQRWRQMPWSASHYFDPDTPGNYPSLVAITAAYWRSLWGRLDGTGRPDEPPIASWPREGQTNFSVDAGDIETRLVVTTAWGLAPGAVNADTVRLLDPDMQPVAVAVSRYGDEGNTIMVRPNADLRYHTRYTLELSPRLRTYAGPETGRAHQIHFQTRCAPERLSECEPLATPRPTLADPPVATPRPPMLDAGTGLVTVVDDAGAAPPDGALVAPTSAAASGCGCRSAATPTSPSSGGLGALAMLLWRRTRRRRAQ